MKKVKNSGNGVLEIRMLGGFSLSYEGKDYVLGRNNTAKFIQLLQLVWMQGGKGIPKDRLIQALYDRESQFNLNNSFYNLIYQMRKHMHRLGLPEIDYIIRDGGYYVMDPKLPVRVDALEFRSLIEKADMEADEEARFQVYKTAFELYKGELLPAISTEIWVTTESLQFKNMFEKCTEWLGEYLKRQKDYNTMYQIYSRAAEIYPFDEWQVYQIDALLCKGEYREAFVLYDKTARFYSEEMGLPPSDKMMKCYAQMSSKMEYCPGDLSEIKNHLAENAKKTTGEGAYHCSYPSFIDAYCLLRRNMERTGRSIYLMLCTVVDYEGKMIQNQEKLKARSEALCDAIRVSLRQGDAFTKYNNSQYLILLVGTKQEDCQIIYRRISRNMKKLSGPRAELKYNVISLAELPA